MKTTLTLDADVAQALMVMVRRRRVTLEEAVNEALRVGLEMQATSGSRPAFVVKPHSGGFAPGIDPHKLNQLVGELENEAVLARARRR